MPAIGFIGLGNMGAPMAANLVKSGEHVLGFDLVPALCEASARIGVQIVASARSTVEDADVVITMLPAGEHVVSVWNDIVPRARQGTLFIDCSTIDVASARKAHALAAARGIATLDAPVSGGGLLSGTATSARGLRPQIRVIGGEPKQADDTYRSLEAHRIVPLDRSDTIADGLRASLAPRTFAILERLVSAVSLVTEEEIVSAMRLLWERMKLVVEPSGAVAAAPALYRHIGAEGRRVGIILSGGNVDLAALPFA